MKALKAEDKKLLNLLQKDDACVPRVTMLAHKLGLPTSTVKTKIDKLVREGYVTGLSATVDPEKTGRGFVAFTLGRVPLRKDLDLVEDIPKLLAAIPEVLEVFFISGEWDYLIKFRVKDRDEYTHVIKKVAKALGEGNGRGLGMVGFKTLKETHKIKVI
ncbi:Lrp/AsnC family transcriptional regulator [archaeon]